MQDIFDVTFNAQSDVGLNYSQPICLNIGDSMADVDLILDDFCSRCCGLLHMGVNYARYFRCHF